MGIKKSLSQNDGLLAVQLLDALKDMAQLIDLQGNILYCNDAVVKKVKLPGQELIGKNLWDLFPPKITEVRKEIFNKAIETKAPAYHEDHLSEDVVYETVCIPILNENNVVEKVAVFSKNVTERIRAEDKQKEIQNNLTAIIENTKDFILLSDNTGCPVLFNSEYAAIMKKLLGIEMRPGLKPHTLLDNEEEKQWWESLHKRVLSGERFSIEYNIEAPDGHRHFFEHHYNPVFKQGEVAGFTEVTRDITERKLAEERYRQLQRQLFQAQKMETIGTLAGGIAHDINNILQNIFTNTFFAKEELPKGHALQEIFDRILQSGQRAADLVDQILTFSRQSKLEKQPVSTSTLVKETLKMLQTHVPENVSFFYNVSNDSGVMMADPSQIHQVVSNICKNAFYALEKKGGVCEVILEPVDILQDQQDVKWSLDPGNYIHFQVSDSGPGIDPQKIDRIYDPFFTTKPVGEGTGLGLSVVHGIVEALDGKIFASSETGRGTTFDLFFPRVTSDLKQLQEEKLFPLEGRERILYVDDEKMQANMNKELLEKQGYQVDIALNGASAIRLLEKNTDKYNVAILDNMMHDVKGVDIALDILHMGLKTKVIIITGNSTNLPPKNRMAANILKIISKPFSLSELTIAIREILDK